VEPPPSSKTCGATNPIGNTSSSPSISRIRATSRFSVSGAAHSTSPAAPSTSLSSDP
jgi:hypothetical protein